MRFSGTERIPASREQVWQFLTDPDAVASVSLTSNVSR